MSQPDKMLAPKSLMSAEDFEQMKDRIRQLTELIASMPRPHRQEAAAYLHKVADMLAGYEAAPHSLN